MPDVTATVEARFLLGLEGVTPPLGLAVSGGGDSRALLELAVAAGLPVEVVTVDHGLRAAAAEEAAEVGRVCAGLGVPHTVLRWQGWDQRGNLMDAARRARARLIGDWARGRGLAAVALGHTRDDVAETFLMRLARGAGVDGLAAMAARREVDGVLWLRPLLAVGREELRDWLRARGLGWIDDPSNEAERFDRVKARRALAALAPLGLGPARLAGVAGHLAEVRAALEVQVEATARTLAVAQGGDLLLDLAGLRSVPDEVQRRLLLRAIDWIASAEYGPRGAALLRFRDGVLAGRAVSLSGVRALPEGARVRFCREARAVAGLEAVPGAVWDGRWVISAHDANGLQVRALGAAGLAQRPAWRAAGYPRASALAQPALWRGETVIAAPTLAAGEQGDLRLIRGWCNGG